MTFYEYNDIFLEYYFEPKKNLTIFAQNQIHTIMTSITVNIPNSDVSFFKAFLQRMGWSISGESEKTESKETTSIPPRTFEEELAHIDAAYAQGQKRHPMNETLQLFERKINGYGD